MELYYAVSAFDAPQGEGSENILSFDEGDRFEIFDCHKNNSEWWGARALKNSCVGYVPSKYMKSTGAVPQKQVLDMQSSGGIKPPDDSYDFPEPEPDYQDDDVMDAPTEKENTIDLLTHSLNEKVILRERKSSNSELDKRLSDPGNDELLIKPKKLANPCIASPARMAVHKELLLNYKMGKNVLEKPELNKVFDKVKEKQRVQEWESQKKPNKRTSLEMKLEQQASKLKEQEDTMKPIKEKVENQSELSRIQSKILSKSLNGSAAVK
ncbi:uncharacterized protein LOC111107219 isoform X3 [Crassostrea virginica]|uniref:Uncharacterized protein LOC111107219 isoform X3 n=1 Tax=Crassostrea virginica TaxID=6565 RepID=A0A8B8B3L3_CRAVI|nr:uncharacterized protein LOC111107219 isoform X3 [Crassostrea virginica]XP_022298818.1 uncharacterized protein LOC111107765 isoform X1 [Crassostrea virginica]